MLILELDREVESQYRSQGLFPGQVKGPENEVGWKSASEGMYIEVTASNSLITFDYYSI